MPYAFFDVDVTEPLEDLRGEDGVAVLARRKGVPIDFWLHPGGVVTAAELGGRVAEKVLAEAIREELERSLEPPPLPAVTVAVCTRDGSERVARLLDSLAALPSASLLDVVVVDNAPSDRRTRDLVAGRAGVRYALEPRPGLDFARNRALAEAREPLLAFLDDDVVVDRHWHAGLAAAVAGHPDAAAYTGLVLPLELETEAQVAFERRGGFRRGFEQIRFGAELAGNRLYPAAAGVVGAGANMVFRTEALRGLGGFDEALDTGRPVPGGGDLDVFYRLVRTGRTIAYEPRLLVFHEHRRELRELGRQYRRSWGLGFMVFVGKCLRTDPERRGQILQLLAWWFRQELHELGRSAVGRHPLPPSMIAGEIAGGLVGLFGGYRRSLRRTERIRRAFA